MVVSERTQATTLGRDELQCQTGGQQKKTSLRGTCVVSKRSPPRSAESKWMLTRATGVLVHGQQQLPAALQTVWGTRSFVERRFT